ncbi:hypothetical protein GCM10010381_17950 [Streptomyces xantholiticus]|nr:hypothetical protein GCM10010381_17950 [Streptomyces xantholiticus]
MPESSSGSSSFIRSGGEGGTGPAVERAANLVERTARDAGAARLHSVCIGAPASSIRPAANCARPLGCPPGTAGWSPRCVGAGIVLDGRLRRGASGGAGEIGFLPVPGTAAVPSAVDCEGGFHSLAGSAAICALGERYGLRGPAAGGHAPPAAAVVAAALAADERAFLDDLAGRLALGAAAVASVLDPGCVVLGGEVGHAGGDAPASRVEARLAELSPLRTEVRAGELGGAAVLSGALLTAREWAQREIFP